MTQPDKPIVRPKPAASFVVFDRQSGEVLLTHHLGLARGAVLPPEDEITRFLIEHAEQTTGRKSDAMECIKIDAGDLEPRLTYRVDLSTRRLIGTPGDRGGPSGLEQRGAGKRD